MKLLCYVAALVLVLASPACAMRNVKERPQTAPPAILDAPDIDVEAELEVQSSSALPDEPDSPVQADLAETTEDSPESANKHPASAKPIPRIEHTGWLYHDNLATRFPVMFESSGHVADRRAGVASAVVGDNVFGDDQAILYPAADDRKAAVCLSQKAGSSRWKMILLKAQTGNFTLQIHHSNPTWLQGTTKNQQIKKIESPDTLRIMFIRNPYARLLSGFLDKACHPTPGQWEDLINTEYGGPYQSSPEEFHRFIMHLMAMRAQRKEVNGHFSPLLEHCGLSNGMRYDLYLKAEEMDEWYPDIVTFLGLAEAAASGFDTNPRVEDKEDITDCFYPLTGATCAETTEFLERYREDPRTPRPGNGGGLAAWQKVETLGHSHGADALIPHFYTKEVAEWAYLMLEMDLNAFGYPKMEFDE